jgi:hypothetical protein
MNISDTGEKGRRGTVERNEVATLYSQKDFLISIIVFDVT